VLDYDKEAAWYDATRGGDARADAAAEAMAGLLPAAARNIVDFACGTGIVTVRLPGLATATGPGTANGSGSANRPGNANGSGGRHVVGIDRSPGMAAVAAGRLPGRVAVGDATRIPLASASADAVTIIWLLHLLSHDEAERVIAEAARVLRQDGVLITTVDKNDAAYLTGDDIARVIWPVRAGVATEPSDAADRVVALGRRYGLEPAAEATFTGIGQGLSPRERREHLRDSGHGWVTEIPGDRRRQLDDALAALPDQDRARCNPVYKLLSLRKILPCD
jgi:ubiquinone/menaquinone biosynthesis C-methylase UbiE